MDTRSAWRQGLWAGLLAGIVSTSLGVVARFSAGLPTVFDLSENWLTRSIPTVVFAFLLDRLQYSAKPLLFVGLLLLQVVLGAVFGALVAAFSGLYSPKGRQRVVALTLGGLLLWLLGSLVFLPIVGDGFFGWRATAGPVAVNLVMAITISVYLTVLSAGLRGAEPGASPGINRGRRRFLGWLAAASAVVALGDAGARVSIEESVTGEAAAGASPSSSPPTGEDLSVGPTLVSVPYPVAPPSASWAIPGLSPAITAARRFYVVSKNLLSDPHLDARQWSLRIDGLVDHPLVLTYSDLLRMPAVELYQTLECISNPIGGELISNAWWRGVPLRNLLSLVGPQPRTVKVVFHAADDYADSVPLATALSPTAALVYQMNRQPLLPEHGYPARILVPGVYGLKNVKWVTRIELVAEDFKGYWQQRGWSDTARVHTMSRVDVPADHATVSAGPLVIAGIAFAGDRGIRRVQVSLDEGVTWHDALLHPPLGPLTWRLWRYDADLRPGQRSVFVQATDGQGRVQWPLPQDTVPDGATGQDVHVFTVRPR